VSQLPTALITGITGQDGSYLAESLLEKGYEVHGIKRRSSSFNTDRIDRILPDLHDRDARLFLHFGDLSDVGSLTALVTRIRPDEVYHLAAQSFVSYDFEEELQTLTTNISGTHFLLAACRDIVPKVKFYFDNIPTGRYFGFQ